MEKTIQLNDYEITLLISGLNEQIEAERLEIASNDSIYDHKKEIERLEAIREKLYKTKNQ